MISKNGDRIEVGKLRFGTFSISDESGILGPEIRCKLSRLDDLVSKAEIEWQSEEFKQLGEVRVEVRRLVRVVDQDAGCSHHAPQHPQDLTIHSKAVEFKGVSLVLK